MYKAGAYIRLSREDGNKYEESNSIKNQRELIKQYIDNQDDISIYEYYSDDGRTGTNFDRPGFQKMIKDMNDKKIDCIIVKDLSRFGRNYIEVGRYIDYIFPKYNIRFIAINDNIDSHMNPESINSIVVPFKNLINDEYCRDISRKIKKVKEVQRLNGEVTNGVAPYGYIIQDKKYVIDENVRNIIVTIFDLYLGGESTTQIAFKLNEQKVDTPKVYSCKRNGKKLEKDYYWSSSLIIGMLKNRTYCGDLVQGKTKTLSHKVKVSVPVPKDEWIIIKDTHEPIIDRDVFNKVQLEIASRTTSKRVATNSFKTEFKGYLKCYDCHKNMIKTSCIKYNSKKYISYECYSYRRMSHEICNSHKITYNELKKICLEIIKNDINFLVDFELKGVDKFFKSDELDKIRKSISEINNKIEELYKLKNDVLYDLKKELILYEDYEFYTNNYDNEIRLKNKELNNLKDREFALSHEGMLVKNFIKRFKKYYNLTEISENLLKDLVEVIYVTDNKELVIKYLYNDIYDLIRLKNKEVN